MDAHHFDMRDFVEALHDVCDSSRRQHQWIATGKDDLPDGRRCCNISKRAFERPRRKHLLFARSHGFTPETEAAIDRANGQQFQQYAVRIAVHDAGDRRMCLIADGIVPLLRHPYEFAFVGHELP